jgi:peptide/nickel transport system substrate-binding protein
MKEDYWQRITASRINRRRLLATAGAGTAAAAFLAACGSEQAAKSNGDPSGLLSQPVDETKNVKRGGTLVHAGRPLTSLDPIGSSAIGINFRMYDTLWKKKGGYLESNKGDLTGSIFESWEVSPDKLQVTAKVTTKAHFVPDAPINGRTVDAHDVAYTWERYKKVGALRNEVANEVDPGAPVLSMTALDDRTVVIKLSEPDATLFGLLAQVRAGNFYVLPREAESLDIRNRSVGSGPWMMKEWAPGRGAFLKRNPGYGQDHRGADLPYMDEWHYPEMSETAVCIAQFKAGGIQTWTTFIPQEELLSMKRENNDLLMYANDPATTSMRVIMGHRNDSPFRDDRVRRATMMTFDRDLALETLGATKQFSDAGLTVEKKWDSAMWIDAPGDWRLDPQSKEFGPNAKWYNMDIAEAKKLLTAAGYPNGVDTEMNVSFGYNAGILKKMEVVMALFGGGHEGLVRYKISPLDYQTEWSPRIRFIRGQIPGVALLQDVDTPEPTLYMYQRFHSKGGVYQGGDSTLDEILSKAKGEFDEPKRMALIHEAQRYEGGQMHFPLSHGGASTYELNWPSVRGIKVWDGVDNLEAGYWLDQTKAPFNKPA